MYNPKLLIAVLCAVLLSSSGVPSRAWQAPDPRAPFALELPELGEQRYQEPEVPLARLGLTRLKFWVLNPFADQINPGQIKTFVNGEAANVAIKRKGSALDGQVIELDLQSAPRFALQPAKNVIEISATDRKGQNYYASFVLLPTQRNQAALAAGPPEKFLGRKFAVLIGVSEYLYNDGGLSDLSFADDDARALRDFLLAREGGGFKSDEVLCLTDQEATINSVRDRLTRFLTKANPDDLVYVFIAGHGFPDPYNPQKRYYAMHDSKLANLPGTAFEMTELNQFLRSQIRARRVVAFIDTCHSAGLSGQEVVAARGQRVTKGENNLVNLYSERLFQEQGWAVLTSSDVNESSQESAQWGGGHGIFTWAILEGMKGASDANRDGQITAGELFGYVRTRVSNATRGEQHPRALPGNNENLTLALASKLASNPSAPPTSTPPVTRGATSPQAVAPTSTASSTATAGKQERSVLVQANLTWNDTRIDLQPGRMVNLTATGAVKISPTREVPPAGLLNRPAPPTLPLPGANIGALLARICGPDGQCSPVQFIGAQNLFNPGRAGRLQLGINDGDTADNSGAFRVTVRW